MAPVGERGGLAPRALLRDRTFMLFEARGTANVVGYAVYLGTVLWISYRLTGGTLWAGLIIGIQTAVFTLTFLIGPIVDRIHDKRRVFVICYPLKAGLGITLGLTYAMGLLSIPLLVAIVILFAILYDFTEATDVTTTRILFGKDNLFIVTGIGSAIGGGLGIALYFAAGVSIAFFGAAGGAFLVAGLLGIATALAVPVPILTPNSTTQGWRESFREGWAEFRGPRGRPLRHMAVQQAILGFFVPAPIILMTLYLSRYFLSSEGIFATFYVAYLVGGIIVGVLMGHLNPRAYIGVVMLGAMFALGVALIGMQLAVVSVALSTAIWLMIGAADKARNNSTWLYLQGRFEPDRIARVSMNMYLFTGASSAIGAIVIGVLSTLWSPPEITVLVAAGFIGSAGLGLFLEETRRLSF